ncbi:unnamed protein product [Pedinophyceae sp. YPF-701]|nr:unnamed protein product [Pedinophyceae sp. YPF-701]
MITNRNMFLDEDQSLPVETLPAGQGYPKAYSRGNSNASGAYPEPVRPGTGVASSTSYGASQYRGQAPRAGPMPNQRPMTSGGAPLGGRTLANQQSLNNRMQPQYTGGDVLGGEGDDSSAPLSSMTAAERMKRQKHLAAQKRSMRLMGSLATSNPAPRQGGLVPRPPSGSPGSVPLPHHQAPASPPGADGQPYGRVTPDGHLEGAQDPVPWATAPGMQRQPTPPQGYVAPPSPQQYVQPQAPPTPPQAEVLHVQNGIQQLSLAQDAPPQQAPVMQEAGLVDIQQPAPQQIGPGGVPYTNVLSNPAYNAESSAASPAAAAGAAPASPGGAVLQRGNSSVVAKPTAPATPQGARRSDDAASEDGEDGTHQVVAGGAPEGAAPAANTVVRPRIKDTVAFLDSPAPADSIVQCYIMREKVGKQVVYKLYLNEDDGFLLAATKRKHNRTSNYLVSLDEDNMNRDSKAFFGKLRSNFVGTEFTIYDHGINPKKAHKESGAEVRCELGAVMYQANILGTKGPRKMSVVIPVVNQEGHRVEFRPLSDKDSILSLLKDRSRLRDMILLKNKSPKWNDALGAYCLNFNGRVTHASIKNFQLISDDDPEYVVLQFGKVGRDAFTMDYRWPMSALQAFSICLSSFDSKLACE